TRGHRCRPVETAITVRGAALRHRPPPRRQSLAVENRLLPSFRRSLRAYTMWRRDQQSFDRKADFVDFWKNVTYVSGIDCQLCAWNGQGLLGGERATLRGVNASQIQNALSNAPPALPWSAADESGAVSTI